MPSPPRAPPAAARPPASDDADTPAGSREVAVAARHLTVVWGARRHDVLVDPDVEVGAMLDDLLPAGTPGVPGPPGVRWVASTLTGEVLEADASIVRAGLVDGSVVVASARATVAGDATDRTDRTRARVGSSGDQDDRGVPAGRAPTGSIVVAVAGCCGLALSLFALAVVGLPRAGVPPVGAALLVIAVAASMSRVVPDLVLRLTAAPGSPGLPGGSNTAATGGSVRDTTSVQSWVRLVARRQQGAHVAVLLVVLVASGILLAVTARVSAPVSGPVLGSTFASALMLGGSARGRSRGDRWSLAAASAVAVVPALVVAAGSLPTPVAAAAAYASVLMGLVVMAPARRRRRPGLEWSRLVRAADLLVVVAVLPLACWAAGLLTWAQAWTP